MLMAVHSESQRHRPRIHASRRPGETSSGQVSPKFSQSPAVAGLFRFWRHQGSNPVVHVTKAARGQPAVSLPAEKAVNPGNKAGGSATEPAGPSPAVQKHVHRLRSERADPSGSSRPGRIHRAQLGCNTAGFVTGNLFCRRWAQPQSPRAQTLQPIKSQHLKLNRPSLRGSR